jgi:hypothetical protein
MTTIHLRSTIIQFREKKANDNTTIAILMPKFAGCLLGFADTDGHDLVAAFPTDEYARRFLHAYYQGEEDQIGTYALGCRILETR